MTNAMAVKKDKITLATFKSFINKHRNNLFIMVSSDFDGMTDCVQQVKDIPHKVEFTEKHFSNTLGIRGLWLVGSSRDYFSKYEDELFTGITVCNCCGKSTIAIIK